ncbi:MULTISPECIES: HAD-IA family hydrolase [unclassified Herbaspirillum]|uniref:HAD-IA family hydrolase n=1 Tax=unclassified Herbaspirillum TaxID=2624150 RepID=UPI000E2F46F2|nr:MULTISPECIES: HAD-IA family hydrolase [unclassified Herbaspirillum]RFB67611.1 HAD family hydrolase [Herbaspirillum sp. 3R-3a1]TFI05219.1 HAD family hydrolase [Herbaspirillum sp. 3R11]TFI12451.1 HAD family hydrolase [Herbaspirillum sp. 3R-11]TFI22830.1 HAD family hydrolase [Herbaspirillum sp. 3C11]
MTTALPAIDTIDLILFDCDGTLVDSEIVAADAWVEHSARFGVSITAVEALEKFKGVNMADCVAEIERLAGSPLPASFVTELRDLMAIMFRARLQPIAGALELVQSLAVPFCLASNAPREKIELCLRVTGMLPYFEGRIYSAYDVQKWKPDPALFLHAAAAMGVAPARCAVVEDSLPGVKAGLAAGMTVFALQSEDHVLTLPDGVHVIRELAELPGRLAPVANLS